MLCLLATFALAMPFHVPSEALVPLQTTHAELFSDRAFTFTPEPTSWQGEAFVFDGTTLTYVCEGMAYAEETNGDPATVLLLARTWLRHPPPPTHPAPRIVRPEAEPIPETTQVAVLTPPVGPPAPLVRAQTSFFSVSAGVRVPVKEGAGYGPFLTAGVEHRAWSVWAGLFANFRNAAKATPLERLYATRGAVVVTEVESSALYLGGCSSVVPAASRAPLFWVRPRVCVSGSMVDTATRVVEGESADPTVVPRNFNLVHLGLSGSAGMEVFLRSHLGLRLTANVDASVPTDDVRLSWRPWLSLALVVRGGVLGGSG